MAKWVKFTGEGDQSWNGDVVAIIQGVGVTYKIGCDNDSGDCFLMANFAGPADPQKNPKQFGGRFTGPVGFVAALSQVVADIATDSQ